MCLVVAGCKVGIQLALSVRTLICGPCTRLCGFFTVWSLVSMSKCPNVEDTSFLMPRCGHWYSISSLYSNGQVVTKQGSKGEDMDLFLKGRSLKEFQGHVLKLTEFEITKMVQRYKKGKLTQEKERKGKLEIKQIILYKISIE